MHQANHGILWVAGWAFWAFTVLMFVGFVQGMRGDARKSRPIHIVTATQTLIWMLLALAFVFTSWNKLPLLWLMPAGFLGAYFDFIFLRIPVVGTILRTLIVVPSWLFLAGTDGVIRSVPHGK